MWDLRQRCLPRLYVVHLPHFIQGCCRSSFAEGKVVFFAGGTGHPYFSTDTATVLRALRSAQMPFFLPRLLTESMTVIRR